MPKFGLLAALIFFCLSCATARTDLSDLTLEPVTSPAAFEMSQRIHSTNGDNILKPPPNAGKTFVVNLGPKLVELKASYLEKL